MVILYDVVTYLRKPDKRNMLKLSRDLEAGDDKKMLSLRRQHYPLRSTIFVGHGCTLLCEFNYLRFAARA